MKSTHKGARFLAMAICLSILLSIAAPALAATVYGYSTVTAATATVYGDAKKSSVIGSFKKGDILAVVGATSDNTLYQVLQGPGSSSVGYVLRSQVGKAVSKITSGKTLATMSGATAGTGGSTSTPVTGGSKGKIVNVKNDVNFRATASSSGKKLGALKLGTEVTVLGKEGGFYKLSYNGKTGYVAEKYVEVLTPSVTQGYVKASTKLYAAAEKVTAGSQSLPKNAIVTVKGEEGDFYLVTYGTKEGYLLKSYYVALAADTAASGSGTITASVSMYRYAVPALGTVTSLKKNAEVVINGENGNYYNVTSGGKTGYVLKTKVKIVEEGGSTVTTGGKDTGKITVGKGDIKVTPGNSKPSSTVSAGLSAAKKKNSETYGYIYVKGTNISQPVLYRKSNVHYYANHDINKSSSSAGAAYTFFGGLTRNNVITAHNMRTSGTMFHELHHIYDKTMGNSKCQTTDAKCANKNWSSAPDLKVAGNRTFEINFAGYNTWEVWAMYKTNANEPKSTINNNIQSLASAKPAAVKTWIETQKNRSDIKFNTAISTDDIFMTVYTCGTNFDSSNAQSRLYIFLKAVK
ncbi:SH3 domain-containing protein [Christensenellaceae bacterium OttesenSCG-928-L17]|nr:SH3 domain-containing protein [Christensenellaceae bacterium OttesenSCG-928-L17]